MVLIRDTMSPHPVFIEIDSDMRRAAEILSISNVSDLMVVDRDKHFLGVLSEGDIIRAMMPDYEEIMEAGGMLEDAFKFFIDKGSRLAEYKVAPLVITDPVVLNPEQTAAEAATIMVEKQIRRLPVVENGKLVGTVARADILRAVVYLAS